jgi:hypothetical protein
MTRDNEKGEEFGFGHGGLFMRSRPAFAYRSNGFIFLSSRRAKA